jgi:hypothetical protein
MMKASSTNILDKLFSNPFFKDMDTAALVQQYDRSSALRQGNRAAKPAVPPKALAGMSIASIPPEGLLIAASGQYEFANDITWSPTSEGFAITIMASGVVLDLKGHTLSVQSPSPDTAQQYSGVSISGSDVTVQGGTVNGATYYGLSASLAPGLKVQGMTFGAISYVETAAGYTPCGIFIDLTDGFTIENCTVQNISVTAPSCAGIQILASKNGTISSCTLTRFLNNDGGVQGFTYLLCEYISTSGCKCENFQAHYQGETIAVGHSVLGFFPTFCANLGFDHCSSTNMTGCCDDCHGMSVFLDTLVEVNNFSATNVVDGVTPKNTGAKATGIEVYGVGIILNNCTAENITVMAPQDRQGAGFSAWGTAIIFNNCTATNVKVIDASGTPSIQYGYGTGFGWAPDPRRELNSKPASLVQYNGCVSRNCQLGFDTWFHVDSVWKNVSACDCPIFILIQPLGAARTLSMDKCSESPDGKYQEVTLHNIASNITYL